MPLLHTRHRTNASRRVWWMRQVTWCRPFDAMTRLKHLPTLACPFLSPVRKRTKPFLRTLVLCYGNPDRQDDGVAFHIMVRLARELGYILRDPPENDGQPCGWSPDLMFVLQLSPELAETLAQFDRICFVDAHAEQMAQDIVWQELEGEYQASPLTHHITPATCLSLVQTLYNRQPEAVLVSIRGYEFDLCHSLSPRTACLAEQALQRILAWI